MLETLLQDAHYALRTLRKRPLFSATAILTLALGIGANTAIFSVVNAALLRPLPFPRPEQLVKAMLVTGEEPDMVWSYPKYETLRDEQHIFVDIGGYAAWEGSLAGVGEPERLKGEMVTARYFDVLGVAPRLGRVFTEEETRDPGRSNVALLSDGLWRRRFNADPSIVGRAVQLEGKPATIVGVIPAGFRGLTGSADIFMPVSVVGRMMTGQFAHFMTVIARLAPDVTMDRAKNDMVLLGKRIDELHHSPRDNTPMGADVKRLDELRVDPAIRRSVLVLFGAVTAVLLIACANVANLLLARAVGRRREIGVRLAIGAGRGRLVRQLMTEAIVLALIGGLVGVMMAWAGTRGLAAVAANAGSVLGRAAVGFNAVSLADIQLHPSVLLFALGASVFTGVLFGLAPALQASRADLTTDLKQHVSGRGAAGRNVLVVSEIAVAFVLLVGSGLMLRSLARLLDTDAGVDPRNMLTASITLPQSIDTETSLTFWQQLLTGARALPGVTSVAVADCPPLIGRCNVRPFWKGDAGGGAPEPVGVHYVTPGYLETLRIALKSGRVFEERDRAGTPNVVVINETAARKFFPGEDPIGKRVAVGGGFADGAEVIGVIADQRFSSIEEPAEPDVYIAYAQQPQRFGYLFIRTTGSPTALAPALRRAVQTMDPNLPIYDVQTMEQRVSAATARTRITGLLLAFFAAIALALALIGIYGVVAYAVTQRTNELGIRIALGAARSNIAGLVLKHSAGLVGAGLTLGLGGAFAATRVLRSLLYEVEPADPFVFAVLSLATLLAAFLAGAIPALRAARVDPIIALKTE